MTGWTAAELFEAESAALAKHILAFVFALIFFVNLFAAIRRGRKEPEKRQRAILPDAILGAVFLSLFAASVVLLLTPENALRFTNTAQKAEPLRGIVAAQRLRPYLWGPSSAGSYAVIGGKTWYLSGVRTDLVGAAAELTALPETAYALTVPSAAREAATLPYPWYLYAGRILMLLSGLYIAVRLVQISAHEAVRMKKKQDMSNPVIQYFDPDGL